jgi:hypothetical protein
MQTPPHQGGVLLLRDVEFFLVVNDLGLTLRYDQAIDSTAMEWKWLSDLKRKGSNQASIAYRSTSPVLMVGAQGASAS